MTTATRPAFINELNRFAAMVKFIHDYPEWERARSEREITRLHEHARSEIKKMGSNMLLMTACTTKFLAQCTAIQKQVDANYKCCMLAYRAIQQYELEPSPELLKALEYQAEFLKRPYQL